MQLIGTFSENGDTLRPEEEALMRGTGKSNRKEGLVQLCSDSVLVAVCI